MRGIKPRGWRKASPAARLIKEREAEEKTEETGDQAESAQEIPLENLKKPNKNVVKLSPSNYKTHVKCRDILAKGISSSSTALHKGIIKEDELVQQQRRAAQKAIRAGGAMRAMRAWTDLFGNLLTIKDQKVNGIPLEYRAMVDFWSQTFNWSYAPAKENKAAEKAVEKVKKDAKKFTMKATDELPKCDECGSDRYVKQSELSPRSLCSSCRGKETKQMKALVEKHEKEAS